MKQAIKKIITFKHWKKTTSFLFSYFLEQIEVLEYHQKFEVELSPFPGCTSLETPRNLLFFFASFKINKVFHFL